MPSLIEKLNALPADIQPDNAVIRINTRGWMRHQNMTEDDYLYLDNQYVIVGADNGPPAVTNGYWLVIPSTENWPFHADAWRNYPKNSEYYWCRADEWDHTLPNGDLYVEPDPEA